ncbi:hypothetical protein QAD02_016772 [Eretmocerus hayati]|uniref:Uncharacterized protein n=1 Tax=Eretmocerus hayati TaxID=131215 RepID=A0ACC2PGV0_9HYME|nr:hypothetical protein QAD02_016772 [Eretmocerus hayati]
MKEVVYAAIFNPAPPALALLPGNAAALPAGSNLERGEQALVPAIQPGTARQLSTSAGQHALPQIPLRRALSAPARRPEVENPFREVPTQNPPSIGQGPTAHRRSEAQSSVASSQQRATSEQQLRSLPHAARRVTTRSTQTVSQGPKNLQFISHHLVI